METALSALFHTIHQVIANVYLLCQLPTNDSEAELIAINFESSTAVSLVTGIEHNIKRIVGDGLMEKEGSHGQDSEPEEVPQADGMHM